jgi:hypothetical protein
MTVSINRRQLHFGLWALGTGAAIARTTARAELKMPEATAASGAALVVIDCSGDAGFRLEAGASATFVAALVSFASAADAQIVEAAIRATKARLGLVPPLKFKACRPEVKDALFAALAGLPFAVRAVVVRKSLVASPRLRADEDRFQRFFVQRLLAYGGAMLDKARVAVDGTCDRAFRKALAVRLARRLAPRPFSVTFSRPESDLLVQLADLCAGAVARSYRTGAGDGARWRGLLGAHLQEVREIV